MKPTRVPAIFRSGWELFRSWWRKPPGFPSAPDPEGDPEEGWGSVRIDTRCRVHVVNPKRPARYAVLVVPEGSETPKVRVNGEIRSGEVVVQRNDRIEIDRLIRPPRSAFAVTLDPDERRATLTVTMEPGLVAIVPPQGPGRRVVLAFQVQATPPPPIAPEAVWAECARRGITCFRISDERLKAFLENPGREPLVVAETPGGRSAGQNFAPVDLPSRPRRHSGRHPADRFVEAGTVIAIAGEEEATTVTGRPIPRRIIVPGPGVAVLDRGRHLVAERPGRVEWTDAGVRVLPERVCQGLTKEDGVTAWDGDLIVEGAVSHGFVVVTGDLVISGSVEHSTLYIGGCARIYGTMSASAAFVEPWVGIAARLQAEVQTVGEALLDLADWFHELAEEAAGEGRVPPTDLVRRLVDFKFRDLPDQASRLYRIQRALPGLVVPDQHGSWLHEVSRLLGRDTLSTLKGPEPLVRAGQSLRAAVGRIATESSGMPGRGDARLQNVRGSVVRAAGDLTLRRGENSTIETAGALLADHLVGGFYQSGRRFEVGVLGDPSGTETSVRFLGPDEALYIRDRHPGVAIRRSAGAANGETVQEVP